MSTEQTVKAINDFMAANPNAKRTEIAKGAKVSAYMLEKINKQGLVKLPAPLSFKQSAQVSKAKRKPEVVRFVINPNKKRLVA
jgi:hypothetical protein